MRMMRDRGRVVRQRLVGVGKGGVGKTLLATLLADALGGAAVLKRAPEAVRMGVAVQRLIALLERAAEDRVDRVGVDGDGRQFGPELLERRLVVEFSSAALDGWLAWARDRGVAGDWAQTGLGIDWLIPATADEAALVAAAGTMEAIQDLCLPDGVTLRCFVVLNWKDGGFDAYAKSAAWSRLQALGDRIGAESIHVPRATTELWPTLAQAGLPPSAIIAMTIDEIVERFGIEPLPARRGMVHLIAWYTDRVARMLEVGLFGAA